MNKNRTPGRKAALKPDQLKELLDNYHLEPVEFFAERYGVHKATINNYLKEVRK